MREWLYLAAAIVAEVAGTSALVPSDGFTRLWPSLAVIVSYSVAFFFLALTLRVIPVGIAYAVWAGAGMALITLVGWAVLGQRLDPPALVGIALIVAGVLVLNVFSESAVG